MSRLAPKPATYDDTAPGRGFCVWCAEPLPRNKDGSISRARRWHPWCAIKHGIMNSPQAARINVYLRDRGVCAATGESCGLEPYAAPYMLTGKGWAEWVSAHKTREDFFSGLTAQQITDLFLAFLGRHRVMGVTINLGTWEVDHIVPLWKVAAMPPERRAEFFTMSNMQTLSVAAHQRKSGEEAAERAHFERLERERRGQPKHRKMLRRRMDGTVERQPGLPW